MKKSIGSLFIFPLVFFILVDVGAVYAAPSTYIDPNTGGMLFQILAVVFTLLSGIIFFFSSRIKMGFARVMRFLREMSGKTISQKVDSPPSENR